MAFDKRDYWYHDEVQSDEDQDDSGTKEIDSQPDRFPAVWVQSLMFRLQEMSKSKGVELLDRCTSVNLAAFAGKYNKSTWRY